MWRIRAVTNLEAEQGIDQPGLDTLRTKKDHITELLNRCLQERPADEVKVQVTPSLHQVNLKTDNVGNDPVNRSVYFIHYDR